MFCLQDDDVLRTSNQPSNSCQTGAGMNMLLCWMDRGGGVLNKPVTGLTDAPRKPLTGWRERCEGRGVKTDYVWAVDKQIMTFLTSSLLPHLQLPLSCSSGPFSDPLSPCKHCTHELHLSSPLSHLPCGFTLTFIFLGTVLPWCCGNMSSCCCSSSVHELLDLKVSLNPRSREPSGPFKTFYSFYSLQRKWSWHFWTDQSC